MEGSISIYIVIRLVRMEDRGDHLGSMYSLLVGFFFGKMEVEMRWINGGIGKMIDIIGIIWSAGYVITFMLQRWF